MPQGRNFSRLSTSLLIVSFVMLLLSTLCLCLPGEMVGYFLIVAALALIPFGFDSRRIIKLLSLAAIALAMVAADADHDGGIKEIRREQQRKAKFNATQPTSADVRLF